MLELSRLLLLCIIGVVAANHASQLKAKTISPTASEYEKLLHASRDKKNIRSYEGQEDHKKHVEALTQLLFPNAIPSDIPLLSTLKQRQEEQHKKLLEKEEKEKTRTSKIEKGYVYGEEERALQAPVASAPCVICRDMAYCKALNGFQIEEVY